MFAYNCDSYRPVSMSDQECRHTKLYALGNEPPPNKFNTMKSSGPFSQHINGPSKLLLHYTKLECLARNKNSS